MRELSIFADESGDKSVQTRYFLLTVVIHDQADGIAEKVLSYERSLALANLPNIPFHSEPLLNGRAGYRSLDIVQRKKLLYSFNIFVQRLPIRYRTFACLRREYASEEALESYLKRGLQDMLLGDLAFFQSFDRVTIYYDNGQDVVKRALHESVASSLSKQAVSQKKTTMTEYRLAQVADYLCTIELAALKYAAKEDGATYDKFFGGVGAFKKNWLKQARRKLL